jgi:hypothetical protein
MTGAEPETRALLEQLVDRAGTDPAASDTTHLPYLETKRHLAAAGPGEADENGHVYCKSEYFQQPLPTESVAALVEHFSAGQAVGETRTLDFSPWGGAYNRMPGDATAFVHRDDRFLLKHEVSVDPATADPDAARRWLARSWEIAHPHGTGRAYQNFPDPDLADEARAYYGANLERLRRAKAQFDVNGNR